MSTPSVGSPLLGPALRQMCLCVSGHGCKVTRLRVLAIELTRNLISVSDHVIGGHRVQKSKCLFALHWQNRGAIGITLAGERLDPA